MIFKFATDQMVCVFILFYFDCITKMMSYSQVGDIWMFGEKRCNDEFAHKSASSEILGWRTCFFSPIKLFSFPLVALTQFRGALSYSRDELFFHVLFAHLREVIR
jgi:hypothetical protein